MNLRIKILLSTFVLLIYLLTTSTLSCADDTTADIKATNLKILNIEKTKNNLDIMTLKLLTEQIESVPPKAVFYYNPENTELIMVKVSVGHETFLTTYTYYFQKNRILKYLKEITGRPDNPPKEAVIYKANGSILWKNIDAPAISSKKLTGLFNNNMKLLDNFSKY